MAERIHIHAPLVTVFSAAHEAAEPSNTLLYGEAVEIIEERGAWVKIKSLHDSYEGFMQKNLLAQHLEKPHKVGVPITHIYNDPDFKAPPRHAVYFGSPISTLETRENGFVQLGNKGWVFEQHLVPSNHKADSFVETAMMFVNTPYVWGGRSAAGIDCSGLVQIALQAFGVACPRDSHQQQDALGTSVEHDDRQRGDLVFFKGHVGVMVDDNHLLNATARHMTTLIEPLETTTAAYDGILDIKRV